MRTGDLTHLVLSKYSGEAWVALTQVRAATGWKDLTTSDVMILGSWPSTGNPIIGFEVKVSRADWLNEVKNPAKNHSNKRFCNYWYLVVADKDFVKDGELPEDWGLMAVENGKLKEIKVAPELTPEPLDNAFIASLLRHNDKELVPTDVLRDKVKDARLDAEAACKKKYEDLLSYVRFLNKELGINMKQGYSNEWVAVIGRFGRYRDRQDLVALLKSRLAEDLEEAESKLDTIKRYANEILELAPTDKKGKEKP